MSYKEGSSLEDNRRQRLHRVVEHLRNVVGGEWFSIDTSLLRVRGRLGGLDIEIGRRSVEGGPENYYINLEDLFESSPESLELFKSKDRLPFKSLHLQLADGEPVGAWLSEQLVEDLDFDSVQTYVEQFDEPVNDSQMLAIETVLNRLGFEADSRDSL